MTNQEIVKSLLFCNPVKLPNAIELMPFRRGGVLVSLPYWDGYVSMSFDDFRECLQHDVDKWTTEYDFMKSYADGRKYVNWDGHSPYWRVCEVGKRLGYELVEGPITYSESDVDHLYPVNEYWFVKR